MSSFQPPCSAFTMYLKRCFVKLSGRNITLLQRHLQGKMSSTKFKCKLKRKLCKFQVDFQFSQEFPICRSGPAESEIESMWVVFCTSQQKSSSYPAVSTYACRIWQFCLQLFCSLAKDTGFSSCDKCTMSKF